MSRKLTEQWQNGTLEDGYYYVKENDEVFISPCSQGYLKAVVLEDCEVLAPVPTYEEYLDWLRDFHGSCFEWCPKCEQEVELINPTYKTPQECPNCGEWILPCCLCDDDDYGCCDACEMACKERDKIIKGDSK